MSGDPIKQTFVLARIDSSLRLLELMNVREIIPAVLLERPVGIGGKCCGLAQVRGELIPVTQPTEGVTYARKISREDGRLDWTLPARVLYGFGAIPDAASRIDHNLPPQKPVAEGVSGTFFAEQSVDGLAAALTRFDEGEAFAAEACRANVVNFGPDRFRKEIKDFLAKEYPDLFRGYGWPAP